MSSDRPSRRRPATGGSEYAGGDKILDSFANRTADELEGRQLLAQRDPLQR